MNEKNCDTCEYDDLRHNHNTDTPCTNCYKYGSYSLNYDLCISQLEERVEKAEKALAEVTGNNEYTRSCGCVLRGSWLQKSCEEHQNPTFDAYTAVCNNRNSRAERAEQERDEALKRDAESRRLHAECIELLQDALAQVAVVFKHLSDANNGIHDFCKKECPRSGVEYDCTQCCLLGSLHVSDITTNEKPEFFKEAQTHMKLHKALLEEHENIDGIFHHSAWQKVEALKKEQEQE